MKRTELSLSVGAGGWVAARVAQPGAQTSYVHFLKKKGKLIRSGWVFANAQRPDDLAAIPLIRIERAVNTTIAADLVKSRLNDPAAEIGTTEFFSSFDGFMIPEPVITLVRPPGRRLDDAFYAQVAEAYQAAATLGRPPRTAIAEEAGVSTDVAGRWVYEARKRGYLAKTDPGKVTV